MITSHILSKGTKACSRESGNAVLLSILLLSLLGALATAQFTVVNRNIQASSYFLSHSDLHKYAENGVDLAVHDLNFDISGDGGKVGTKTWTIGDDDGLDGTPGTYDEGESDGLPTPGEQHVHPVSVGDSGLGASLIVHVTDTAFANVYRVVATATDTSNALATVDTFVVKTTPTLPSVGAVYVDPDVALDLKGSSFKIDGNDYTAAGVLDTTKPAMPGISTEVGDSVGENLTNLLAQIPSKNYNQILGEGGTPSLKETAPIDLDGLFDSFKSVKTKDYTPGTYTSPTMGKIDAMDITYVSGNLHISGNGKGAGVLIVDGSLEVTGQFTYYGLVMVRGDVKFSGGGAGIHTYGSVMVGESLTAVDSSDATVTGTADLRYSSEILMKVMNFLPPHYAVVYYDDK
jgi:hypothetical protein